MRERNNEKNEEEEEPQLAGRKKSNEKSKHTHTKLIILMCIFHSITFI